MGKRGTIDNNQVAECSPQWIEIWGLNLKIPQIRMHVQFQLWRIVQDANRTPQKQASVSRDDYLFIYCYQIFWQKNTLALTRQEPFCDFAFLLRFNRQHELGQAFEKECSVRANRKQIDRTPSARLSSSH